MNNETRQFIIENVDADIHSLALLSSRFPKVDMPLALRQINGKQKTKGKIPTFFNNDELLFPVQLSLEQSSSELTARYKAGLCGGSSLIDLSGGFGVDCYFMSENFNQVTYVEQNEELCRLAEHNFQVLKRPNIQVIHSDSIHFLKESVKTDWLYIDPARRNPSGKKVVLLSDCEPNIPEFYSLLMEKAMQFMIKLSPMMDITAAVRDLPATNEIHILSVNNECKEVLLLLEEKPNQRIKITTVNFNKNNDIQQFEFYQEEETETELILAGSIETYLYEPNASILKSGAFKLTAQKFGLQKLHINTHLYTSSKFIPNFPGRVFEVLQVAGNSRKEFKELAAAYPKANLTVRNYPQKTEELRKKLHISDGGDSYLFACTLWNNEKAIICCRKVQ